MLKLVRGTRCWAQGLSMLHGSWLGSEHTQTVKQIGSLCGDPILKSCSKLSIDFCKFSSKCPITSQILGGITGNHHYRTALMHRNGNYIRLTLVQCYQLTDSRPKRKSGGLGSPVSGLAWLLISCVILAKWLGFSEPLAQNSSLSNVSESYSLTFLNMATNRAPSHPPTFTCSWQSPPRLSRAGQQCPESTLYKRKA